MDGKVVMVGAAVYGLDAAPGREFLSSLASMPIRGVSPAAARAWVEKSYPLVREGRPAEKHFGHIKFELIGNNQGFMSLRELHKDYTAWATKRLECASAEWAKDPWDVTGCSELTRNNHA